MKGYTAIIYHPNISEEERARRIEEIKKAMIEVKKEMIRNEQKGRLE
jgi:hypothetical protein